MCCSSVAAKSPMAEFLKSQSPQELWKAAIKPKDPMKFDPTNAPAPLPGAAKTPGTGLVLDVTA